MTQASGQDAFDTALSSKASASSPLNYEWMRALTALKSQTDPHQAALCFMRCCETLQALIDDEIISPEEFSKQRSELMSLWAEGVRKLKQVGANSIGD